MPVLPLIIFLATYAGLAVGRIPGLGLDRTGFAVLGAVAMLACGAIGMDEARNAVHVQTLAVLFGMMLLSAQYRMAGLYTVISNRLARAAQPRNLMLGIIVVTVLLSAVLTNDVVCVALTPLLGAALLRARLNPLPFFLALACASNIGSALTPIGNPQNIYIAQKMGLPFAPFVVAAALPVLLSLVFLYWFMARRPLTMQAASGATSLAVSKSRTAVNANNATSNGNGDLPLLKFEAAKAVILTIAAIALFLSPVPAALTALGIGGVVLTSRRMRTREMLGHVDWQLLALFIGLFIVVRGFELSGWPAQTQAAIARAGVDINRPVVLAPLITVLSNMVSNVPAVMVVEPFLDSRFEVAHLLAVASTFAGNALIVGSIANIIVAQQAEKMGISFGFRDHLRVGLPITLVSLALAIGCAYVLPHAA